MDELINSISNLVWSQALIALCGLAGLYFTIRLRFIQITQIKNMLRLLFSSQNSKEGITPFQAFSLAISGRVGTGNIIGVATAIAMGGPGAIFWMWIIAFIGSTSAFVEATLGQVYKQEVDGQYRGGPAYYIEKGLGIKWYAVLFAIITIISCGLLLPGIQSNSIYSSINNIIKVDIYHIAGIPFNIIGLIIIILLGIIIIGGVKRLGKTSELIVPFMAGAYIIMAIIIVAYHYERIPETLSLIVRSAFNSEPLYGGVFGYAIAWGVKRGIYSNEAGQGTAPHVAAAAEVRHPAEQGLVQAFSVYIDTLFVCTMTAFMILFTGKYNVNNPETTNQYITENLPGIDYTGFTQAAVSSHFPSFGNTFVAAALFFFAFTTIMAYYYYAETNITYIFQKKKNKKIYIWILRVGFLLATYYGTVKTAETAWAIGDIGVGTMAWVNVIAILLLSNVGIKVWNDYYKKRKKGIKKPDFDPKAIGINNALFWEKRINDLNKKQD
ncbi:alanine/glycine:cation symporter family protein [Weeksella virosa]|uniref:Amino acid carrier protein n=1 Tax=Weeksella virosa (strain ATCC 43766 / DSM 16922 / JCM 21250 / CCUG 30538 / CDC 9751 / IAM 14551 / NBRC 16016 / NCTC 11634 / CL345/78) TaxID=865938 RepID=F0P236_WEEVC|nr:alanine/glycine:cation symporter family protein [Weeksella virosa]ADX68764.1 amino acid carrier protein [Weeksella virosa DSM 16922]SUP55115.1 Na+/alanine symporter [Weeksella virosa]VEH63565.1 Na+/alanine symporter [Weeksella virosa]